ncbi:D-alanyl-D-alanine carboxypeptidase [Limimonas halophila]|uniref:D-alanyl-D-alanine carboxypeptidase n=1 Tax=Limimonas halophila TaxID=1082479 RepID=A0A1G7SZ38_9PROT|nr:D-alanyl-D-alanine carboxypeptidase family protein [Limimonas halophila]SDG28315.1 D-alanyl-D-alanine carboxypeptidase [Limimonas halophila]
MLAVVAALVVSGSPARAGYASIVVDAETGEVLHAANSRARLYPASLTKMMTLYMTFEALKEGRLKLNEQLYVSRRAAGMTPTKLHLRAGETISVRNAILGVVTKSANDAAVVLAEALARSEFRFALKMTETARELGMRRTQFRNASGLPNRHQVTTARDMARLADALIDNFPHFYRYFQREAFTYDGHTYHNHNNLLDKYAGTDGIKTGYTSDAGFNLVASVERRGRRLIGVVMGGQSARSRDQHMMTLLDRAFAQVRERRNIEVVGPPSEKPSRSIRLASAEDAADNGASGMGDISQRDVPVPPDGGRPADVRREGRTFAHERGQWAVQVGAYSRAQPARLAAMKAAEQAPTLLTGTDVAVTRIDASSGHIYRARLRGLARPRAMQACRLLEAVDRSCLVIQPGGGVEVAFQANEGG